MPNRFQTKIIKDALDHPELLSDWENERMNEWAEKPDSWVPSEK